jgi:2-dehydro-3-deoxyphosphogluconate aldolase / (4S)-4-hydroxy-2-oxoglutarate aldolase
MNKQEVIERMCASGILPVFRTSDLKHLFPASKAFLDAGIGCVEYTMTMPNALELVKEGRASLPMELCLGAGTVMDGPTVDRAVAAGAQFIASPGIDADMIRACVRHGVVSVVGAITPSEIMEALRLGADVIKVFPATSVGPGFFAEVLGPFPGLPMMAAGGMSLGNVKDYVAAGAQIVTFLANGLDAAAYAAGDCAAITRAAAKWVDAVRAARPAKT